MSREISYETGPSFPFLGRSPTRDFFLFIFRGLRFQEIRRSHSFHFSAPTGLPTQEMISRINFLHRYSMPGGLNHGIPFLEVLVQNDNGVRPPAQHVYYCITSHSTAPYDSTASSKLQPVALARRRLPIPAQRNRRGAISRALILLERVLSPDAQRTSPYAKIITWVWGDLGSCRSTEND